MSNSSFENVSFITQSSSKSGQHRNDDFAFAISLLPTCLIGILGDFTSDSPGASNEKLQQDLSNFISKNTKQWIDNDIEAESLLKVIVTRSNSFLAELEGAKTTLIAYIHDTYLEKIFYTSIGDSGLAVVSKDHCEFLIVGDQTGTRDARGFLPLKDLHHTIRVHPLHPTDVVVAYSDGLWENFTNLITNTNKEIKFKEYFSGQSLDEIKQVINGELFHRSSKQDDLTFLVSKKVFLDRPIDQLRDLSILNDFIAAKIQFEFQIFQEKLSNLIQKERDSGWSNDFAERLKKISEDIGEFLERHETKLKVDITEAKKEREIVIKGINGSYKTAMNNLSSLENKFKKLFEELKNTITEEHQQSTDKIGTLETDLTDTISRNNKELREELFDKTTKLEGSSKRRLDNFEAQLKKANRLLDVPKDKVRSQNAGLFLFMQDLDDNIKTLSKEIETLKSRDAMSDHTFSKQANYYLEAANSGHYKEGIFESQDDREAGSNKKEKVKSQYTRIKPVFFLIFAIVILLSYNVLKFQLSRSPKGELETFKQSLPKTEKTQENLLPTKNSGQTETELVSTPDPVATVPFINTLVPEDLRQVSPPIWYWFPSRREFQSGLQDFFNNLNEAKNDRDETIYVHKETDADGREIAIQVNKDVFDRRGTKNLGDMKLEKIAYLQYLMLKNIEGLNFEVAIGNFGPSSRKGLDILIKPNQPPLFRQMIYSSLIQEFSNLKDPKTDDPEESSATSDPQSSESGTDQEAQQ